MGRRNGNRGEGSQTMSVVIMNRNEVHIGKRFFIIRSVGYQVKYVLEMSYLSQRPQISLTLNHQIVISILQLILH